MNNTRVYVVGCGLLGSMFAPALAAHIVSLDILMDVTLVDFDIVEKRNSPANLGVPDTIGTKKVDVVSWVFKRAEIPVSVLPTRVTKKSVYRLKNADIIVGAVDNIKARLAVHDFAMKSGIPYIDMGVSDLNGIVAWTHKKFGVDTMQYADKDLSIEMPEVEKQPPCTIVATRLLSALVVECAAKSLCIYTSGHDPFNVVNELTSRKAKNGDMVGWNIVSGSGVVQAIPVFLGGTDEQKGE